MSAQYPDLGQLHRIEVIPRNFEEISDEENWGGTFNAYLTNDIDTWGKHTVHVLLADGDLSTWYLFEDEYKNLGVIA